MINLISQTNRTILFEEINPNKLNILTLIGDSREKDSLDDETIKEINNNLLVTSFDDFLEKFEPKIYSYYNVDTKKINYLLKKPEGLSNDLITEININSGNTFFKMLNTLIDTRKSQGDKNVDFNFENILELLSPKKVIEDIKQTRKEINYLFQKYENLEDDNPKKLEIGDKLNYKFEDASQNYNNILGMLPLAIEDIKTRLLLKQENNNNKSEKIRLGMLNVNEKGDLEIIDYKYEEKEQFLLEDSNNSNKLAIAFREDYENVSKIPNKYVSDLLVRTFVPLLDGKISIDISKEVQNYNNYLIFYKNAQEDFIKVSKPLIEKLLGVKMFFEQYNAKISKMKPTLLVTNTKADFMIKAGNKERIVSYLNTVNSKNDFTDTIWFGIYPNVDFDIRKSEKIINQRFKGSKREERNNKNTIEVLSNLMDVLRNYKIQVFFNFECTYETTFDALSTEGIDKYIEKTKKLESSNFSEYLLPVMPNFTVIPKDKSGVILDYKMIYSEETGQELSKDKEDLLKFWIEGIYIDSSYIAAGIIAATQCPSYLKDRFKSVSSLFPGVRFDLESEDNAYKARTIMPKEISGFTSTIKDKINYLNYGFIFSSDSANLKKEKIKNITVYKARTLARSESGVYEPLYKTLTTTYIERILRFVTTDFKEDKINHFFSTHPESQKSLWLKEDRYVNSIIQSGDDLSHTIDKENNMCQLNLTFSGNVKNLQVEINKN